MYFHRIARILPPYAFVMGFCYFIVPMMNSGPMWSNGMGFMREDYDQYWWTLFLFVSNLVPDRYNNNCFGIGWYLSNDMQFFLFGPLLVHFALLVGYYRSKYNILAERAIYTEIFYIHSFGVISAVQYMVVFKFLFRMLRSLQLTRFYRLRELIIFWKSSMEFNNILFENTLS